MTDKQPPKGTNNRLTFESEKTAEALAKIKEMTSTAPARKSDIAATLAISERYLSFVFAHLRKTNQLYIKLYKFSTDMKKNLYQAYYAWGPGEDAAKPRVDERTRVNRLAKISKKPYTEDEPEVVWTKPKAPPFVPRRDWASAWVPDRSKR